MCLFSIFKLIAFLAGALASNSNPFALPFRRMRILVLKRHIAPVFLICSGNFKGENAARRTALSLSRARYRPFYESARDDETRTVQFTREYIVSPRVPGLSAVREEDFCERDTPRGKRRSRLSRYQRPRDVLMRFDDALITFG